MTNYTPFSSANLLELFVKFVVYSEYSRGRVSPITLFKSFIDEILKFLVMSCEMV